jgi:hypothetical protein
LRIPDFTSSYILLGILLPNEDDASDEELDSPVDAGAVLGAAAPEETAPTPEEAARENAEVELDELKVPKLGAPITDCSLTNFQPLYDLMYRFIKKPFNYLFKYGIVLFNFN